MKTWVQTWSDAPCRKVFRGPHCFYNTKFIHVLFLWTNLQGKELKMPEDSLRIWELSLQRQSRIWTLANYPAFSYSNSCHKRSPFRGPGPLARFPWRWCRCVGLSISRDQEKQVLGRNGFKHHPRIVLIPCHGGSKNTFCSRPGSLYFPPFIQV